MTAFGAGAAVSPLLAGLVAQYLGFSAAFVALALVAGAGLVVWTVGRRLTDRENQGGHSGGLAAKPT